MKYVLLGVFSALLLACNVNDQKASNKEAEQKSKMEAEGRAAIGDSTRKTTIQWLDPEVQNLGSMEKGQIAEITWRFKNTGDKPLFVTSVHAQCGCTTPDPPKEPIAPGEEGRIKAKFNSSNFSGHVTKEVYVEANNSNLNNNVNNRLTFTADIK